MQSRRRLVFLSLLLGIICSQNARDFPIASAAEVENAPNIVVQEKSERSEHGLFQWRYHIADSSFCYAGACVDVDSDGTRDLFFASRDTGAISRLNAADGTPVWSRRLPGSQQSISAFDLNGDGSFEVLYTVSDPGILYVLDASGNVLNEWDSGDGKLGNSPIIIDTEGDGILNGYLGSRSRYLFRLNMHDLSVIERRESWSQCGCHLSAMDVHRDGRWTLFAGDGDDISKKGLLHGIDPRSLNSIWTHETNDNASSADPVLVDLNGDGKVEILKSVDNYGGDDAHDAVFALSATGDVLWKVLGLSGEDTPNAADLNGDGEVEIVGMTFDCVVYCLDSHGNLKWQRDLRPELDHSAHAYMTPILCDLNGDSQLEILAMTNGGYFDTRHQSPNQGNGILFALSPTGEILDQLDLGGHRFFGEAFVCQLDDSPYLSLVLSGSGGLDVISLQGLGPHTEYFQRRRTYRRLNVWPWMYEDQYFLHRGVKDQVAHHTDNLVLSRENGEFVARGSFVTELLKLPPECEFRQFHLDAEIPEGTDLTVEVLDDHGRSLLTSLRDQDDVRIRQPVQLKFHFQSRDARRSPKLHGYSLAFDKIAAVSVRSNQGNEPRRRVEHGDIFKVTADVDRVDSRVYSEIEVAPEEAKQLRLVELTADREVPVPVQVAPGDPTRLWWIARGEWPAGVERTFRLDRGDPEEATRNMTVRRDEGALEVRAGSSPLLRYQMEHRVPPAGIDAAYGRSAHIHPVWTPKKLVVTDEFPPDHAHQSGIFLAYPKTSFEGREPNFWDLLGGTGYVRFKSLESTTDGPVFAEIVVENEHVDRTTDPEKVALNETWTVRAWNVEGTETGYFVFDIESQLKCAGPSPLELPPYHYGGMAIRGGRGWGVSRSRVRTSEGLADRDSANHSRPRWCTLSGSVLGEDGELHQPGITFCTHPDNFRFPEPLRVHPTMPYMVYTPQQLGATEIVPETTVVSKYRFVAHDGELPDVVANRLWHEFASPLRATLVSHDAAVDSDEEVVAWTGARVMTMEGQDYPSGTLVVRDGKILAVGSDQDVVPPPGARVIDARGKIIMPGLICTHSHIGGIGGADASHPIQPDMRIHDSINVRDSGFKRAVAGGLTTLNIMSGSGHLLGGQTIYVKLRRAETIDDMMILADDGWIMGGLKMANGTNPMREASGFPGTRGKSAALVRQFMIRAREYGEKIRRAEGDPEKLPPRDIGLEAMLEVFDKRRIVHHHTHRHDDIMTVLRLAAENDFRVVLHHVSDGWKLAEQLAAAEVPCSIILIDAPGGKIEARDLSFETGAILERAGVLVAFHTDDYITDSRFFFRSAALAVRAGMSREGALKALTINGAKMLDLDERTGSLAVEKDADFIVLDRDPLSVYAKVLETWVEGVQVFDRSNPQDRLYAVGGYGATHDQNPYFCCYHELMMQMLRLGGSSE
jgi:imidazolonepropionase-like amidohydrolase/outer membrane protein assembly factor BamB